jgi:hypothetical protein
MRNDDRWTAPDRVQLPGADRIAIPVAAGLGDEALLFQLLQQVGPDTVMIFPLVSRSITLVGVDLDTLTLANIALVG